ncbi:hypothetical protein ACMA1I_02835 [Pontibacter sp. 13R65]|uniref:hypothetical protein n=1 Tax=Pontibacter sp. 13R65 TaxID=3127458 RepID=UPI00301D537D
MKPEEVDKIFKERLGNSSPTPPADLWNRLQERIETEMPQAQPEQEDKKGVFLAWYRNYGVAAAVALLLAAGLVFFSLRQNQTEKAPALAQTEKTAPGTPETIAQNTPAQQAEAPGAVVAEPGKPENITSTEPASPVEKQAAPAKAIAKTAPVKKTNTVKQVEPLAPAAPERALATLTEQDKPEVIIPEARVTTAEKQERVEIIIKRSMNSQTVAMQQPEKDEPLTGLDKKQQVAKSIFKQVKNIALGEPVELSDLGIHTDQIALETQIGKQKFSKVINL